MNITRPEKLLRKSVIDQIILSDRDAWWAVAKRWITVPRMMIKYDDDRKGAIQQLHLCCGGYEKNPDIACGQSIWIIHDGSVYIGMTPEDIVTAVLNHLRNGHRSESSNDGQYSSGPYRTYERPF